MAQPLGDMEQPLILPKGVFVNSPEISGSIAWAMARPVDPREIQRLWTVYTTTQRALRDPTAARLENFWWRIWGSRSRELQSITVSTLFAYISDGNSFVPLTSSANRDEGPPPPAMKQIGFGTSSSTAIHRPSPDRHSTTPKISIIPPPSILKNSDSKKKARGPSTGGPRPTARFISPHESETESVPISPNSHVVVQPPTPIAQETKGKKTVVSSGKKRAVFVASNGRTKRPGVLKRQGSQSSTDSPAKGGELAPSSSDQTPPLFVPQAQERTKKRAPVPSQETTTPSEKLEQTHSTSKLRSADATQSSSRNPLLERRKVSREEPYVDDVPGPSRSRLVEDGHVDEKIIPEELEEIEIQRLLLMQANASFQKIRDGSQVTLPLVQNGGLQADPTSTRNGSNGTLDPAGAGRLAQTRNKSAPSFASTLVDANGQLEVGERVVARRIDKGKGRGLDDHPKDDMFSKRPVQSVASSSIPDSAGSLSRSKSQLTLLLEKDRARSTDLSSDKKGKIKQ